MPCKIMILQDGSSGSFGGYVIQGRGHGDSCCERWESRAIAFISEPRILLNAYNNDRNIIPQSGRNIWTYH